MPTSSRGEGSSRGEEVLRRATAMATEDGRVPIERTRWLAERGERPGVVLVVGSADDPPRGDDSAT
jgi:hypothetical protein